LKLGGEVRLKNAYIIKAESVKKDADGNILEVHCTYDNDSLSGSGTEESKRKVKGTLHWVSIKHAKQVEVRVYDRLFIDEAPDSHKDKNFMEFINPNSLHINKNAFVEPSLAKVKVGDNFQFQRLGYFNVDNDSTAENIVFNRTVALKDSWAKVEKKQNNKGQKKNATASVLQKEIMPLTGKYLKAREEDVRLDLIAKVFEFSKQVPEDELMAFIGKAESNKDYLTALMILNSENVKVNLDTKAHFELINGMLGKALKMNNSYVRFQAVDCIGKNLEFKENHLSILKTMQQVDKNTHVVDRLGTFL
jgi:glutaminyl-tRNA synthetase